MKDKLTTNASNEVESPAFLVGAVISCFSSHHSYFVIPEKCKGKRTAFQKGWEAKQNGLSSKNCPYDARIKNIEAHINDYALAIAQIQEQIDHNEFDLKPDEIERGNFTWVGGIQDTTVQWNPNPNGRFWIAKHCHPTEDFRNRKEKNPIIFDAF